MFQMQFPLQSKLNFTVYTPAEVYRFIIVRKDNFPVADRPLARARTSDRNAEQ